MTNHARAVELARLALTLDYVPVEFDKLEAFDRLLQTDPSAVPTEDLPAWTIDFLCKVAVSE